MENIIYLIIGIIIGFLIHFIYTFITDKINLLKLGYKGGSFVTKYIYNKIKK
jgi:hypothetical protein